jgi:hypothetical protein
VPAQPTPVPVTPAPAAPAPSAAPATAAQPAATSSTNVDAAKSKPRAMLGMALATPDTSTLPGRFRPAYGVAPVSPNDFKFDFHGYLQIPLRVGINTREHATSTQYKQVYHAPPLVPDDFDRFEHTGVTPQPWVQVGFSYGNSRAVANVIIAARTATIAAGYVNPPDQLGINDAFITFKPDFGKSVDVNIDVGGFANRYGAMGEYDLGRYDTPIIGRVGGVGETLRINVPLPNDMVFLAEHGVMGQFDRVPLGVEPAGWNDFADPNVGSSFAHHAHLGLALPHHAQAGLHYIDAFTRDDRTAPGEADGSIVVFGADGSIQMPPFGRLYAAWGRTNADHARSVSGVIRVLNGFGGPGLMKNFLGPNSGGTGHLSTFGGQYDVSIGEIVRNGQQYSGYGPDVFVSLFGMYTHVASKDFQYDNVDKVKYGGELTYSALSWLAFGGRYDRVIANTSDTSKTFAVITPRLIFRSDYNSQDQVTLQYSHWFDGSGVNVRTGYPPQEDPAVVPDADSVSIMASMWW